MEPATLFKLANNFVLPGWLLLVFLPRWKWTTTLIASVAMPGLLAMAYVAIFAASFGTVEGGFSAMGSLAGVKELFQNDWLVLGGWIHYLAFDLFIGSWQVRDARRLNVPHLLVVPCLALTLMLGPTGLLLYLIVRAVYARAWLVDGPEPGPAAAH